MRDVKNWKTWDDTLKEWLQDPKFRRGYERMQPRFEVAKFLVGIRIKNNWTQKQLAHILGLKQSEVSLIESGDRNLSLKTLQNIAEACGAQLSIQFLETAKT